MHRVVPLVLLLALAACEKQRSRGAYFIALRRYEELINDQRAGVYEVLWVWDDYEGQRVVKDTTRHVQRTVRMMDRVRDRFESDNTSVIWRTEAGELLKMETTTILGNGSSGRTDREIVTRTATGYAVTTWTGKNKESYEIPTARATYVDPETFLGPHIRAGKAKPGSKWNVPTLVTGAMRAVIEIELEVIGPDDEGPGLKVAQRYRGATTLWWFDCDGAVVRVRSGRSITRRADEVGLDALPPRPASWRITLEANVNLPRIFTGKRMVVDVFVDVDETTTLPRIPENPFTRPIGTKDNRVRLELLSHDDPAATTTLPVEGFEKYLAPTRLMEVDDPVVRATARRIVGDVKDARLAATMIADWVFRNIGWESPPIAEPTATEILENPTGDCSEHCLLFVALCRAAGIPARRCSGWVCIGEDWGGHAWCEIWLGKWIGADPTTNEIGTRARYIMLSRPDEPEIVPGSITAEKTEIMTRRAEYDDGVIDLEADGDIDPVVYTGIRTAALPDGWVVDRSRRYVTITAPGWDMYAQIEADHGYRALDILRSRRLRGGRVAKFGKHDAVTRRFRSRHAWLVPLGRELLFLNARPTGNEPFPLAELVKALEPTLNRE